MKVRSLVTLLKPTPDTSDYVKPFVKWLPVMGEIYTVRDLSEDACGSTKPHLVLEEGVLGFYMGKELAMPVELFRELLPPMDLSELVEEPELLTA